jgi:uncharacterized membrane protein (UPF0127 family)
VPPRPSRRRYLQRAGTALTAALAGCSAPFGTPAPADGRPTTTANDAPNGTGTAATGTPRFTGYETTGITVRTADGDVLGSVMAAIADTPELRYRGLSDTETLPEDRGMLFVYEEVGERTYVMREMDFGLDIVYADDRKAITRIHHAPEPGPTDDGEAQRYPGRGQYVLEVNYTWTTERGVEEGDVLAFDL